MKINPCTYGLPGKASLLFAARKESPLVLVLLLAAPRSCPPAGVPGGGPQRGSAQTRAASGAGTHACCVYQGGSKWGTDVLSSGIYRTRLEGFPVEAWLSVYLSQLNSRFLRRTQGAVRGVLGMVWSIHTTTGEVRGQFMAEVKPTRDTPAIPLPRPWQRQSGWKSPSSGRPG